jgi:uncharacterized membrane protein YkvA (DUF1232 family)
MARLVGTLARMPRYLMLAQALVRDQQIPARRKAALGLGIGYVASPIDLIPGIIPVLGQLDDLAALLLALKTTLDGCTPEHAEERMQRAGLSATALEADIRTVKVAAMWLVISTASLGGSLVKRTVGALGQLLTSRLAAPPNPKSTTIPSPDPGPPAVA